MKRISTFLLAFVFTTGVCAQTSLSEPREDAQNWNEVELSVPLGKKVDLNFFGELRLGRNLTHFVDERA